jgi:hypothetical protein
LLGHVVVGVGFGPRLGWLHSGLGQSPWPSRPVALFLYFLFSFFKPDENSKNHTKLQKNKKYQISFLHSL